jgi:hypothetical protein
MRITHDQKPNPPQTAPRTAGQGPFGLDSDRANDHLFCSKVMCRHYDIPMIKRAVYRILGEETALLAITLSSYAERLIVSYLCHAF